MGISVCCRESPVGLVFEGSMFVKILGNWRYWVGSIDKWNSGVRCVLVCLHEKRSIVLISGEGQTRWMLHKSNFWKSTDNEQINMGR